MRVADVAAARRDYLDESGGRYVHVIADGRSDVGDIAKAIACGADAVMVGSPLARASEPPAAASTGARRRTTPSCRAASGCSSARSAAMEEILFGPSRVADGTMNLVGALRRAMATTGYTELKEFQRIEIVVLDESLTSGLAECAWALLE